MSRKTSQWKKAITGAALAAVIVVVGVLEGTGPASAESTIVVDGTDDIVSPVDGVITLREAFVIANSDGDDSVISLQPGVEYTLDSCFEGELPHTAAHDLTIDGNGATIYQTCVDKRILTNADNSSTLTVRNLTLTGGFFPSTPMTGAAISVHGPLRLEDTDVRFIRSGPLGGPYGSIIWGGDMFSSDVPNVEISGGLFANNSGTVIRQSGGPATIVGAEIGYNEGSGIGLIDGTPLTVADSNIHDNTGSGVRTTGQGWTEMTITNSTITENGDTGVSCGMCSDVTLTDVTVSNNGHDHSVLGGGVVITMNPQPNTRTFQFIDSFITGNHASNAGGGVRFTNVDSPFDSTAPAEAIFDNTKVSGNETANNFGANGGGIFAESVNVQVLNGSAINGNSAGPAGGAWSTRGGGIQLVVSSSVGTHPDLTILDSEVSGNRAAGHGGGVSAVTNGEVRIERSTIDQNEADDHGGGGLSVSGADTTIVDSTISNNTAGVGGGVAVQSYSGFANGTLDVNGSTFYGNQSTFGASGGGGLFINIGKGGVKAHINNSTFTDNSSTGRGGGIMAMQHSSVHLDHVTLADNTAPHGSNLFIAARALETEASVFVSPLGGDNCDLSVATVSHGDNFATDASCDLSNGDDVVLPMAAADQVALHAALFDNGGYALTRMPSGIAPFSGMIPVGRCTEPVDQRDTARPQGGACEPGAVETDGGGDSKWNVILGTNRNNRIKGTPGDDIIYGLGGNDTIYGLGGNDIIYGGKGHDKIYGGDGDDKLYGEAGRDHIEGGAGDDYIDGGKGRDVLIGGNGDDKIEGEDKTIGKKKRGCKKASKGRQGRIARNCDKIFPELA